MKGVMLYSGYWRRENISLIKSLISAIFLKTLSLVLVMFVAVLLARRLGPTDVPIRLKQVAQLLRGGGGHGRHDAGCELVVGDGGTLNSASDQIAI